MDRQHAAAEPEQRDEYATEWAHRELNTMPIAVTQTNTPQAMLPIDGRDTLNSFPTSANPRDISHSTSWMTFQPYQQRAGFIGCDHGQGSGLPEEVQQELAEAELRHTVARYEILEKAKAFSPSSHSRIIDAPYMDPVIGSTITDYGGESGPSNALMHSHQLFNHGPMPNDSDSMRDFNLGVWPTQQIPDTAFDLNPSQNGVHDPNQMSITLPNIHVDDPSAPYQAMYPLMLNVWYEEISAMDKNLITSSSVKDHLQSSLADRILHIYRSLFPTSTAGKTLRTKGFESPALALSLFHSTTGLLPSHYRQLSMGDIAWNLLLRQKTSIRSDENLSSEKADPHCQKPPEHSFPALKAYVPAQLLAMLGLDTETQDFSANSKWMEPVEVCILKQLANYDAKVQKEILGLSPYTLSVGTKALFDKVNRIFAEEGLVHQDFPSWDCGGRALLPEIVNMSVRYGTMLIASLEFWSSLHEREVTLAEFVMENRDLEDKYFHVLARDPESTKIYAMSVVLDWACSLGWRVDMEVAEKIVAKMLSVIG
ncbi:unnamed protein product [Alternaria alternata]